ncbi:hypothetical protein Vretimale_13975 [Volvox reticuliferus]|uniref:Uncharacterized protein n=1 Tax=Volvox reticuliferus TaxID=1737510 RepID=A0A8J4CQV2_9CHLO|nr:hypothetical protein Vretifemale_16154 [Volvox reticuliferus]GIM10234.1 hypothetical protein Vretimale_13975 [Volvox reticuliferus]
MVDAMRGECPTSCNGAAPVAAPVASVAAPVAAAPVVFGAGVYAVSFPHPPSLHSAAREGHIAVQNVPLYDMVQLQNPLSGTGPRLLVVQQCIRDSVLKPSRAGEREGTHTKIRR